MDFFFSFHEQSSLARTRYNSFWSPKLELNPYAFTATEGVTVICYLLAQAHNCLNCTYLGVFLNSVCLKILFFRCNANTVSVLSAAIER